ncbi:MAG TPA: adenylate kinase [Thermoplasmata archaeon]|nr:adenylate kinase [Thermoplasmata archaeon]HEV2429357.1 adenylate kinase [Thermoplasmata archaeon]
MAHIVFLGPPGAGKGTQAAEISLRMGVPHLSTGELLRAAVREESPLGREADAHMRAGRLVPDDLVLEILTERLRAPDCRKGFLLDGFPRNVAQAEALDRLASVDRVLYFDLPESVLTERMTQRRHCPQCGTVYNLTTRPPKVPGRCDHDGGPLAQRNDDTEGAVRTRLSVYREATRPLLEYYRKRNVVLDIDASGRPEEVTARIRRVLG